MEKVQIYHEKQKLQFCLLHSLNNLMQENLFSRAELDAISEKLVEDEPYKMQWTPLSVIFKPHHNILTGNYDVNVLVAALESKSKNVVWHDRRNGVSSIDLDDRSLLGIMLNIPVRKYGGLWVGRHWVSLRSISGVWYNLDSDLDRPRAFQQKKELVDFLDYIVSQGGEVLAVFHDKP